MTILIELCLGVATFCLGFWWWRNANKNRKFYENIPGPPTIPILGNALDLRSTSVLLDTLMKYTKTYGGLVKVKLGPVINSILVTDYKMMEFVLGTTQVLKKSEDYDYLKSWLGSGLLISSGLIWKKHRKILTPAFHFKILEQFLEVFELAGDKLVQKLEKEINSDSVDIAPYITLCSLDIICESIMGTSINAQDDNASGYVQSVHDMCRLILERTLSVLQMNDFIHGLSQNYRTQQKLIKILHEKSNTVINQRRRELNENKKEEEEDGDDCSINAKQKKPFLDLLLEARVDGQPLTQEEIRDEVDTFMFAGHDTTSSALSFTLFCLANNPEVQKRAFEEQQAIFEDANKKTVSYTDLQNMKYLELVIKETLRLYPSVPFIGRETKEEVKYGDTTLPRDDTILLFIFGMHRNPKYFENPEKFDPSRFETMNNSLPYAYIPFSAGPRNCIGQKFAMLEMKSVISKVLRNFELVPSIPTHKLKLLGEIVLKSSNGIKIKLKKRI